MVFAMGELSATVFIWYPDNGNVGHCSMYIGNIKLASIYNPLMSEHISVRSAGLRKNKMKSEDAFRAELPRDNSYVSWWPKTNRGGRLGVMFLKQKGEGISDLARDIKAEGSSPHVQYTLFDLDQIQMILEWKNILYRHEYEYMQDGSYRFGGKNCAAVVWRILCAGGIKAQMPHNFKGMLQRHSAIWTPKKIAMVCNTLSKIGRCDKAKSLSCPSKTSLALECVLGLR